MAIEIERITASPLRRSKPRCSAPRCNDAAGWCLVDREMPERHAANLGERPCCTAHIAETYANLRGAQVVAHTSPRPKVWDAPKIAEARHVPVKRTSTDAFVGDARAGGSM